MLNSIVIQISEAIFKKTKQLSLTGLGMYNGCCVMANIVSLCCFIQGTQ